MKTKIIILLAGIIFCLACSVCNMWISSGEQRRQLARVNQELMEWRNAGCHLPLIHDTIRDSVPVVDQSAIRVREGELQELAAVNQLLLKELGLKNSQIEALQTTERVTIDSVKAEKSDSVFYYNDRWADLRLNLRDSTFYYNIRDSLSIFVYREYKHRFLWWRWGTKGYRVKMVNFNPHTQVSYNHYVRVEKD